MAASNSKLLNTISVSFENDQQIPNSCSVEINLQPNSPLSLVDESNKLQQVSHHHLPASIIHQHQSLDQEKEKDYRSDECVEVLEGNIANGEMDAVECQRNSNLLLIQQQPLSFDESRNDDAEGEDTTTVTTEVAALSPTNTLLSPPAAVKDIFRRNQTNYDDYLPPATPQLISSHKEPMARNDNNQESSSSPSLIPRIRNHAPPSPGTTSPRTGGSACTGVVIDDQLNDRRTFYKSSVSYDGLFEVRKAQSSVQGVTLGRGSAKSIYLLYDELRQISSASITQADEALEKQDKENTNRFVGIITAPNGTITNSTATNTSDVDNELSKRLALLSRADEILFEARKACEKHHNSSFIGANEEDEEIEDGGDSGGGGPTQDINNNCTSTSTQTTKDHWDNQKEVLHQRIKRTQSLDRVLSTKEVLDLATLALQQKDNERHSQQSNNTEDTMTKRTNSDDSNIQLPLEASENNNNNNNRNHDDVHNENSSAASTSEQAAMLDPQAEFGSISSKDKALRNKFLRIQANGSLNKTFSSASEQTLLKIDILQEENCISPQSLPSYVPSDETNRSREKALKRLDGIKDTSSVGSEEEEEEVDEDHHYKANDDDDAGSIKETGASLSTAVAAQNGSSKRDQKETAAFSLMRYLWGDEDEEDGQKGIALACGARRQLNEELKDCGRGALENKFATMATSLMRRKHHVVEHHPSYPETVATTRAKADPQMRDWIDRQFATKEDLPLDGSYLLGKSRTVVVHEILRGNWTWCTAWSPDGTKLAIGTETHHLAIVSTSTTVWRISHDKRIFGPVKNDTTHSIRSIAWGSHFIAIGGIGGAVSILAPSAPYPILHTIKGTGFVGSLDWRIDSTILAIGSRCNKAMIVALSTRDDKGSQLQSEILETIARKNWVNAVAFSPGGLFFAVGDAGGQLSIFRWVERSVKPVTSFQMEDSILAISFSPDGKWLYAGGEDMRVTIISSNHWEIVHRLRKNRWVQCVAASRGGTHVCCGGVSSEVSILEVGLGWDTVMNIELKGLVPLSACWHPRDQFLALTGQSESILVVETTNARNVSGHLLRSISPILAVDFSPDGRHAVIGNQQGVITFFKLQGAAFVIAYEMVVTIGTSLCIRWSPDNSFIAVGTQNLCLIVGRHQLGGARSSRPDHASGFSIVKVMRGMGDIKGVAINERGRYVAVCGTKMEVLEVPRNYKRIRSFEHSGLEANAWSSDGRWLAVLACKNLTIYDTDFDDCDKWHAVASIEMTHPGTAVAFGPASWGGLVYIAFGDEGQCVTVVEIRTREGTWETVLRAQRDGVVHDLDWNSDGLLAAAIGNGTVSIMDLSYLGSVAVNEMDYNSQRQANLSFTEIRRSRGRNRMKTVRWIPCNGEGSPNMLACGGTDGELEIVDLTSRERCQGYPNG